MRRRWRGCCPPDEEDARDRAAAAACGDARDLEEAIELTSRAVKEEDFSISVATMEGRLDVDAAGIRRTAMADAALRALLPPVLADFSARFGRVRRNGGMVVVALGKAGGREMLSGSDLDLMLIYHHPADVTESHGARSMPVSQWFVRLAHAYIAALTAPGAEGRLYDVDMRLRPSGNKGPVAVSLEGFRHYHEHDSWTWERMALTRARVIAGPAALRERVQQAIATAITGDASTVRADATAMRVRMLRDLPPDGPWDVKPRPGGQIEVEFIAQVLQLLHGARLPEVFSPTTREALQRLAAAGVLAAPDAALLIRADHTWRTVQGMLRITVGRDAGETLPEASARPLLRALGAADLPGLRAGLEVLARDVRAAFVRYVGEVETPASGGD